jgi:aminopeptidase
MEFSMDRKNFSEALAKYAEVIVNVGLNLQLGQRLNLRADVEIAPLVRAIVKAAYQAGAYYVDVMWDDELTTHIRLENASKESIPLFPNWRRDEILEFMQENDATLSVRAEYPDLFDDIEPEIVSTWRSSRLKHLQPAMDLTRRNEINWCGVTSASPAWAKKVFPHLSKEEALEKLWETIFQSCRVDVNDPIEAWQKHVQNLTKRKDFLNAKHFTALHYYGPGTDLTVGLPDQHLWTSAAMESKKGILFCGQPAHRRGLHHASSRKS